jgi:hypothetical protein
MMPKKSSLQFIMRYGRVKCCKIIPYEKIHPDLGGIYKTESMLQRLKSNEELDGFRVESGRYITRNI